MANTNTTTSKPKFDNENFEQMRMRMLRVLGKCDVQDIKIIKKSDANTSQEVGINGVMWSLPVGEPIKDCPLPVIEVLEHANIDFSILSEVKKAAKGKESAGNTESGNKPDGAE